MIEFFEFDLARYIHCIVENFPDSKYPEDSVFGIPKEEYNKLNGISKDVKHVRCSRISKIIRFSGWDIPIYLIKDTDIKNLKQYTEQNMDFIRSHPELANYT